MIPEDLDRCSDEEIRTLMSGVHALWRTLAGNKLIRRSIEEIRSGKFQAQQHPQPIQGTQQFIDALEQE